MDKSISFSEQDTLGPAEATGALGAALRAGEARHGDFKGPADWVRKNLFNNWYNSIITVIFSVIGAYLAFRLGRFLFSTARWEPVRENMELFMIGLFPREERTRIIVQLAMFAGSGGVLVGWIRNRSIDQAKAAGVERAPSSWNDYVGVYGALAVFFLVALVIGARTLNPWLVALGCVLSGVAGFAATVRNAPLPWRILLLTPFAVAGGILSRIPDLDNAKAYGVAAAVTAMFAAVALLQRPALTLSVGLLLGIAGFQTLSGTGGIAWLFLTIALVPIALDLVGWVVDSGAVQVAWAGAAIVVAAAAWRIGVDGAGFTTVVLALIALVAVVDAVRGPGANAARLGGVAVAAFVAWFLARQIDLRGIDWEEWSGLHLNIIVASASIVLAFPFGMLLALGRRSKLPVLRLLSTVYIELIRGVPLISLLLMGQFFIGLFLNSDDPLSNVTRATAAITMFSAAYIAEIVRGGLQSVPKGQTEAGQALGLAPGAITRLLVLPQALRAVIPAMVGQFISLFKDTSLLIIIGITEFLGIRELVHAQEDFRGFGIAESLIFVAFGFWAFSYTMSRESQRLERRLGVGQR